MAAMTLRWTADPGNFFGFNKQLHSIEKNFAANNCTIQCIDIIEKIRFQKLINYDFQVK